jgi:hypothetical protein
LWRDRSLQRIARVREQLLALSVATLGLLILLVSGVSRYYTARAVLASGRLPERLTYGGLMYERRGAPTELPTRARVGRYQIEPLYAAQPGAHHTYLYLRSGEGELFQPYRWVGE